jgi:hypothetical protein
MMEVKSRRRRNIAEHTKTDQYDKPQPKALIHLIITTLQNGKAHPEASI